MTVKNTLLVGVALVSLSGCEWLSSLGSVSTADANNFLEEVEETCGYAILAVSVATVVFPNAAAAAAAVNGICAEVERSRASETIDPGGSLDVEFDGVVYTGTLD